MVVGLVMFYAVLLLGLNLLVDLAYGLLDPRVRHD
jgi:oligopeptide transport system permease protein